jgi:hypothetical protein
LEKCTLHENQGKHLRYLEAKKEINVDLVAPIVVSSMNYSKRNVLRLQA